MLTSIDRDGTQSGYDLDLTRQVVDSVPVKVGQAVKRGDIDAITGFSFCFTLLSCLLRESVLIKSRLPAYNRALRRKLEAGVACLLEIDLAGARQVKRVAPDARLVFLAPPSWEELVRRLTGRGTEPAEVLERRLAVASEELAAAAEFEVTLVNTSVKDVCRQLVALIENCDDRSLNFALPVWKAERGRHSGPPGRRRHHQPADRRAP